mgnify:CR=1 FL=1
MPTFIRTAGYKVYFWSNETGEPIHFHITKGDSSKNDTKIWVLANGSFRLAHNKGRIVEYSVISYRENNKKKIENYRAFLSFLNFKKIG